MKASFRAAILLPVVGLAIWAAHSVAASPAPEGRQTVDSATVKATPIYLTDFELYVVPPRRQASSGARRAPTEEELAAGKAQFIVGYMASNLQKNLEKAGFTAVKRMPQAERPDHGVQLRGVFAEPDEQNHIRRVVLGSGSRSPQLLLYVCTDNLAQPAQAFYQIVSPETPGASYDPRMGVLITLSSYMPLAKYEFSRDPDEQELDKAVRTMVAQLTDLLSRNALAIQH